MRCRMRHRWRGTCNHKKRRDSRGLIYFTAHKAAGKSGVVGGAHCGESFAMSRTNCLPTDREMKKDIVAETVEHVRTTAVPFAAPKMAPAETVSTKAAAIGTTWQNKSRSKYDVVGAHGCPGSAACCSPFACCSVWRDTLPNFLCIVRVVCPDLQRDHQRGKHPVARSP